MGPQGRPGCRHRHPIPRAPPPLPTAPSWVHGTTGRNRMPSEEMPPSVQTSKQVRTVKNPSLGPQLGSGEKAVEAALVPPQATLEVPAPTPHAPSGGLGPGRPPQLRLAASYTGPSDGTGPIPGHLPPGIGRPCGKKPLCPTAQVERCWLSLCLPRGSPALSRPKSPSQVQTSARP